MSDYAYIEGTKHIDGSVEWNWVGPENGIAYIGAWLLYKRPEMLADFERNFRRVTPLGDSPLADIGFMQRGSVRWMPKWLWYRKLKPLYIRVFRPLVHWLFWHRFVSTPEGCSFRWRDLSWGGKRKP